MEIDIRKKGDQAVNRIRFDDAKESSEAVFADSIWFYSGDCNVWLSKSKESGAILGIRNRQVAMNLIASVQKAIDLGWFE